MLQLRRASPDDSRLLFEWRNDPVTRANFKDTDLVPWDVHVDWFIRSLRNPARLIFIGMEGSPVGTSRLDVNESQAEMSYIIAPEHRRKGYGHALVIETLKHSVVPVRAAIKPDNHASRRIFENIGFRMIGTEDGLLVYMQ